MGDTMHPSLNLDEATLVRFREIDAEIVRTTVTADIPGLPPRSKGLLNEEVFRC